MKGSFNDKTPQPTYDIIHTKNWQAPRIKLLFNPLCVFGHPTLCKMIYSDLSCTLGLPCVILVFQKVAKSGAVDRLTDTSKYTGSHKERFDESGKGKGKGGREELVENTGYVSSYKNAGTYDEKTKTK